LEAPAADEPVDVMPGSGWEVIGRCRRLLAVMAEQGVERVGDLPAETLEALYAKCGKPRRMAGASSRRSPTKCVLRARRGGATRVTARTNREGRPGRPSRLIVRRIAADWGVANRKGMVWVLAPLTVS
jgi:hypothetical protein